MHTDLYLPLAAIKEKAIHQNESDVMNMSQLQLTGEPGHQNYVAMLMKLAISILLFMLLSACASVSVGTKDFIISDADLVEKKRRVPSKDIETLRQRLGQLAIEKIEFQMNDGVRLQGVIHRKPGATATVLLYGNNAFRVAEQAHILLRALDPLPVNVVQFDYRGYGNSDGVPSAALIKSDAVEIFDQMRTLSKEPLVIHGHSFGSFVASYVASQRKVMALVLEGTHTSAIDFVRGMTPWYAKPFVSFDIEPALSEYDNRKLLKDYRGFLLMLVGLNDTVTAPKHTRELFQFIASPSKFLYEIPNADHMNAMKSNKALEAYQMLLRQIP